MSSRFITGASSSILGGFIVIVSQVFAPAVLSWVAFGIGAGVVAILTLAQLDRNRGLLQRLLDASSVALSGLLIGFALAGSGAAVTWMSFAFALAVVGIAFAGLTLNEVANWRAQHRLAELHWLHPETPTVYSVPKTA